MKLKTCVYIVCYTLRRIRDEPLHEQTSYLTTDFLKIIDELEKKMAKARWKMFQYMMQSGLHK